MADVGEVRYKVAIDNSDLNSQISTTENKLDDMGDSAKKSGSKLSSMGSVGLKAVKGIATAFVGLASAAAAGVAAVAKMGIEYNAQMQSYQTAFTTMLGDAEKATALTEELKTLAAQTPLAMTDLADASQILLAFGSSAEELPDQLKRLGDVAQGDAQALGTMATAFGRIQSNGYASLEEINMMIDQGFNPLNIICEKTGETMGELRDRVSDGEVSFEEISEALQTATNEGGQFFNAMENQSKTFEGQMSTLEDNISALTGVLTEDLFANLAETALPRVNEWVDQLMTAAEKGGVEGAIDTAGTVLSEALTEILNGAPKFVETALSLVSSFLDGINDSLPEITDSAFEVVLTLINGFVDMLPKIVETAATLVASLVEGIADHLPEIVAVAIKLIVTLAAALIGALPKLVAAAWELVKSISTVFADIDWGQVGTDVVNGIVNGLGEAASALWDAATNLANKALKAIKSVFKSASPSKEAKKLGATVPQGLAVAFEEDDTAAEAAGDLGRRAIRSLTADVSYNVPEVSSFAKSLSADFVGGYRANTEITVPLYMDGREVARATAWWTGEQLSWEEM